MHSRQQTDPSSSVELLPEAMEPAPPAEWREHQEAKKLMQAHTAKTNEVQELQRTLQIVRHEFAEYRRDHATLTQLQDQSTRLLIKSLYELKGQRDQDPFPPASYDETANWQFTNMTHRQKEYFFRVLLEKMNSSMCGSCFPVPQGTTTTCPGVSSSLHSLPGTNSPRSGNNFSQFLWSLASQSQAPPSKLFLCDKGMQTETAPADPCLKRTLAGALSGRRPDRPVLASLKPSSLKGT